MEVVRRLISIYHSDCTVERCKNWESQDSRQQGALLTHDRQLSARRRTESAIRLSFSSFYALRALAPSISSFWLWARAKQRCVEAASVVCQPIRLILQRPTTTREEPPQQVKPLQLPQRRIGASSNTIGPQPLAQNWIRKITPICVGSTRYPLFEPLWNLSLDYRSRLNEDKIIFNTFFSHVNLTDMEDFHYLELGAFNGVKESNTRFFDVCLGWEGLLIEPNPRVFPALVENRPNSHRMSYAASCSEEEEAVNKTVGFWASAFTNAAQDESVNRGAYIADASKFTKVPCGSLTPVLLDLFPSGRVHFFSLDTEGTEHFILQNIDFSRLVFDVLIAENWNSFCKDVCEAREKTRAIMKTAGYRLYPETVPFSDLYVHPQSEFAKLVS